MKKSQALSDYRQEFHKVFDSIAPHKNRYDVFRDFVTISAIALYNAIYKDAEREKEYMTIIGGYKAGDPNKFAKLHGILVMLLDEKPVDILGSLYVELELNEKRRGQFFTPTALSELMTNLVYGGKIKKIKNFITILEPACGAGSTVLAFVNLLISNGLDPKDKIWMQCVDVDRLPALMCFIQLSLWNVPAEIVVGNSLTLEVREVWKTPAHFLYNWSYKLRNRDLLLEAKEGIIHTKRISRRTVDQIKNSTEFNKLKKKLLKKVYKK